ncbi:hypothetical protein LXL04_018492 [Taraxacum kok-saghyz]
MQLPVERSERDKKLRRLPSTTPAQERALVPPSRRPAMEIIWRRSSLTATFSGCRNIFKVNMRAVLDLRGIIRLETGVAIAPPGPYSGPPLREEYIYTKVFEILKEGLLRFNYEQRDVRKDKHARRDRYFVGSKYDDDIKSWTNGCDWHLGDLLSKLQEILEPDSGWEPVSLTGERRTRYLDEAYRKSLLITDPPTLIKREASIKEEYVYGEVRKVLMDAWNYALVEEKWPTHTLGEVYPSSYFTINPSKAKLLPTLFRRTTLQLPLKKSTSRQLLDVVSQLHRRVCRRRRLLSPPPSFLPPTPPPAAAATVSVTGAYFIACTTES